MLVSLFTLLVYTFNVILSKALLAMIAYTGCPVCYMDTIHLVILFTNTSTMVETKKNSLSIVKPYLVIIANNGYSLKVIRHSVIRTYRKKGVSAIRIDFLVHCHSVAIPNRFLQSRRRLNSRITGNAVQSSFENQQNKVVQQKCCALKWLKMRYTYSHVCFLCSRLTTSTIFVLEIIRT